MRQPRGHGEMIEFGQVICDMDGHNIGVALSQSNDSLTVIKLVCGDILVTIETPKENITMKDGKYCVSFRWA